MKQQTVAAKWNKSLKSLGAFISEWIGRKLVFGVVVDFFLLSKWTTHSKANERKANKPTTNYVIELCLKPTCSFWPNQLTGTTLLRHSFSVIFAFPPNFLPLLFYSDLRWQQRNQSNDSKIDNFVWENSQQRTNLVQYWFHC